MASNGYPQQGETASAQTVTSSSTSQSSPPPPDQVGWYFVEQYYTTLSKQPDQVSLFYNKRSSLVWGHEGEVVPMVQGRVEIAEGIKAQNFKDCKVRVTNVDSQASDKIGILIQVMGEMSIDKGPNKRFVQTFFLAPQANGYFVLNDIFRYLKEEEEEGPFEETVEEGTLAEEGAVLEPEPVSVTEEIQAEESIKESQDTSIPPEADAEPVPVKVEEPVTIAPAVPELPVRTPVVAVAEPVNGTPASAEPESEPVVEEPEATSVPEATLEPEATPEPELVQESPKTDSAVVTPAQPTPVATPPPPPQPQVEKLAPPAAPQKPTWASLLGSSPAPAKSPTPQPPQPSQTTQAPQQTQSHNASLATPISFSGQGWQNVPDSSKRHGRPASSGDIQNQAFLRNVTESVDFNALKEALAKFGTVKALEVIKYKNCGIVEFESPVIVKAARNASPITIGSQNVQIEERRVGSKMNGPGNYGGSRSPAAGQRSGDARQGQGRGYLRGGASRGGSGGISSRGSRGGAMATN